MSLRLRHVALAAVATAMVALGACGDADLLAPVPDGGLPEVSPPDVTPPAEAGVAFGLDTRPANTTCVAPPRPAPAGSVTLERLYANVAVSDQRTMMAQPPGDKTRWFVSQVGGTLISYASVAPSSTPAVVADLGALSGIAVNRNGEAGFLGFAFHPSFATNGRVFVTWTSADGTTGMTSRVGFITSTDGGSSFTSYTNLLSFEQPYPSHNGGGIAFGPDGKLYLSFGDGGPGNDPNGHGQDKTGFFSKILRIDVDAVPAGKTYGIPSDNPFATSGGEPATWAYGFRNPFRFSFDRATGELWAGDVGEDLFEEIDLVKRGGNYGWSCREGAHDAFTSGARCPLGPAGTLDPVIEYAHAGTGRSVIGGYVYRGKAMPDVVGAYFYADFTTEEVFQATFDPTTGAPSSKRINAAGPEVNAASFAEDADGELYILDFYGAVWKLAPVPPDAGAPPGATFPDRLSKTGCFDPVDPKKPAAALVPYDVNAPFWSDGADKARYFALPDGKTIHVGGDGDLDLPVGSVVAKTFSFGPTRVETRLLVRHDDGAWAGYSYEWLDDQSDAVLLAAGKTKLVGAQAWTFPARGDCARCHTEVAGRTLGLELGQLERDFAYPSTGRTANQLRTLEHIGLFDAPLPPPGIAHPDPAGTADVGARARAWLHTNCAMCHRPGGPGRGPSDLRFATPLAQTSTCNVDAITGDLGIVGAKLLVPGAPAKSHLSLRPHALDALRMPPLASSVVDTSGTSVVDAWIASLTACP